MDGGTSSALEAADSAATTAPEAAEAAAVSAACRCRASSHSSLRHSGGPFGLGLGLDFC